MRVQKQWTPEETEQCFVMRECGLDWPEIGARFGVTPDAARGHYRTTPRPETLPPRVKPSTHPRYDSPLVIEGDALVLGDVEAPFHAAEFINRCLDVAQKWNIRKVILSGDFLHFDSISKWSPSWQEKRKNGLSDAQEAVLVDFLKTLPKGAQGAGFDLLERISGESSEGPNLSAELQETRAIVKTFNACFDELYFLMGNHEGRLLTALQTPLVPDDILQLIEAGEKWHIAPYYFGHLVSNGVDWLIEHPKNYNLNAARNLSKKFRTNVIMGHSHILNMYMGPDTDYHYAISAGCCTDEARLPYAAQRHNCAPEHALGAVIVRDGQATLLHERMEQKRTISI